MKARIYTNEELEILKKNMFVKEVRFKREIIYDPVFKLWSIMMRLYEPQLSAKEIFSRAGFDTTILSDRIPIDRIREWLNRYMKYGVKYFIPKNESYSSIERKVFNDKNQEFKDALLKCILKKLEEYNND